MRSLDCALLCVDMGRLKGHMKSTDIRKNTNFQNLDMHHPIIKMSVRHLWKTTKKSGRSRPKNRCQITKTKYFVIIIVFLYIPFVNTCSPSPPNLAVIRSREVSLSENDCERFFFVVTVMFQIDCFWLVHWVFLHVFREPLGFCRFR